MNTKTLSALAAAAVVAIIAAVCMQSANAPLSDETAKNQALFPGLHDALNKIDGVTIASGSKTEVTLQRDGEHWRVGERAGFPADINKLREYLYKLADAQVLDTKTSNPQRYPELGVENPADSGAKSVLVSLSGIGDHHQLIVGLFNGKGGGGTFVRRNGDAQSLLVSGNLLAEKNPAAWIRKDLFDIDSNKIKQLDLTGVDGKPLRVYKEQSSDSNFRVADVPKERELVSDFVANGLGSGLSNLHADDVAAVADAPTTDKPDKAHYLLFDGTVVDVTAWQFDARPYAQFEVSVDAAQRDANIAAEQGKDKAIYDTAVATAKLNAKGDDAAVAAAAAGVPKPASLSDPNHDRAARIAASDQAVADLNRRLHGWSFALPLYEFSNFHKSMDELLKPLPGKPGATSKPPRSMPAVGAGQSLLPTRPASPSAQ